MLTIDQREIAGPATGAHSSDGRSSFRRLLVPVRSPAQAGPALAVAARLCAQVGGALRLVHVRTCDPPLRSAARFYRETPDQAAALLEQALLTAWACGGPRATTAIVDARRGDVALAITWQASAWAADMIVLNRRPRPASSAWPAAASPTRSYAKRAARYSPSRPINTTAISPGYGHRRLPAPQRIPAIPGCKPRRTLAGQHTRCHAIRAKAAATRTGRSVPSGQLAPNP